MKRIYATLALLGAAITSSFAQGPKEIDLGVRPIYGPFDNLEPGDTATLRWEITNNGPEEVTPSDTMVFIIDTKIFGEDVADVQEYVSLGKLPPLTLTSGQKDTLYLPIIEGDQFFTGEDALVDFPTDSKICTWTAIYGYDGDSTYFFNDLGFDAETFVTATTGEEMLMAFTGNNNGKQLVTFGSGATIISECEPDGITDVNYEKQTLNIYPNPTSNEVNFEFEFTPNSSAVVRIADIAGRTVLTKDFGKQAGAAKLSLDVSSLNNGIYLVELTTEGKKAISKLTIKK